MSKVQKIYVGFALNAVCTTSYGGWAGTLKAAENDIRDLSIIAAASGYDASLQFLGQYATTENLRKVIVKLRKIAKQGETHVLFNYSGHGGQILNHETICLYNGQMLDSTLRQLFQSLGDTVKLTTVLDCCHAGGLDRDMFAAFDPFLYRIKAMPPDMAIVAANNIEATTTKPKKTKAVIKHLLACQRSESAYDGEKNGLFTAAIKAVLSVENPTYTDLIRKTAQYTNEMQHPRLVTDPSVSVWSDNEKMFV